MTSPTTPTTRSDVPAAPVGPIVLLAVDGDAMSESVMHTAHRLFGETANSQHRSVTWGTPPRQSFEPRTITTQMPS